LSFSSTSTNPFIGNLDNGVLINVGDEPHYDGHIIPGNLFMIFQGFFKLTNTFSSSSFFLNFNFNFRMFAAITPCLAFGSAAERTTVRSSFVTYLMYFIWFNSIFCVVKMPVYLIFLFVWSTLVYDIVAYWTWSPNGWLMKLGVLDFAGGTPVHVVSGFSAVAYSLAVGPRKTVDFKKHKPSNISDVYLGTALLWFGWFGFNGGSELAINSRAVNAIVVSNLSASVGGLTWMLAEMIKNRTTKMSLNGLCAGAIAGLVCITPAAGFVTPYYSLVFGFIGIHLTFKDN
jgi:ammonium transporter, Amt family